MTKFMDRSLFAIGTCFGLGLLPVAPGTFGALLGVPIFLAIVLLTPAAYHIWLILAAVVLVSYGTVALGRWAESTWAKKDPGNYVLDEVAGFLTTVLIFREGDLVPLTLWAFFTTRFFDIIKVPPAGLLERIPGGWGILLDDTLSAVYAASFLYALWACYPQVFYLP